MAETLPSDIPEPAVIRERFLRAFETSLKTDVPVLILVALMLTCCGLTVIGLPLVFKMLAMMRQERKVLRTGGTQSVKDFVAEALPVFAYPLMVNGALLKPGGKSSLPGLVLISFDETISAQDMAKLIVELTDPPAEWTAEDRSFASGLFEDMDFQRHRRRQVPLSVTGGREVFACDLMMDPRFLLGGFITESFPVVPCLAERGPSGRIIQLAWWILTDDAMPPQAEDSFKSTALSVHRPTE
jgi:hypothetical protein